MSLKRLVGVLVVLVSVLLCLNICLAYTRTEDRIGAVYAQYGVKEGKEDDGKPASYRYTEAPFLLTDGNLIEDSGYVSKWSWVDKANCLAQGGCNLFSYAHAIEWLEGKHLGDDLLVNLLEYCCSPSNNKGHNFVGCQKHGKTGNSFKAYNTYAKTRGIETTYIGERGQSKEAKDLRILFNEGKALIIYIPGHYVCAVDYVICDGNGYIIEDDGQSPLNVSDGERMYVQIIDSAPSASSKNTSGRFYNKIYEPVADENGVKLVKRTASTAAKYRYGYNSGKSYFVLVDSLNVCTTLSKKETWPGHQTSGESINRLLSLSGTFEMTKAGSTKDTPYASGMTKQSLAVGDKVKVTSLVTNSYGNIWAKLSNGAYTCFDDISKTDGPYMKLVSLDTAFSASGVTAPSGTHQQGKGFGLYGTISGSGPILSVTANVIDNATGKQSTKLNEVVVKPSIGITSVNVRNTYNGHCINDEVTFGSLPVGSYTYKLTVQPGFTYQGRTYQLGSSKAVYSSTFSVSNGSSTPVTPTPQPGSVVISNFSSASGEVVQGTDIPMKGTVSVTGGAKYLLSVEGTLNQVVGDMDTETVASFHKDLSSQKPTSFDLATLTDFVAASNPKNMETGRYFLTISTVTYMGANGVECAVYDLAGSEIFVEEPPVTPTPVPAGNLLYGNLKTPNGETLQRGDVIPLTGEVSVTGGAKYLISIEAILHQIIVPDGGEDYIEQVDWEQIDFSPNQVTRYDLADIVKKLNTTLPPGDYYLSIDISFMGGDGYEHWDVNAPWGEFTLAPDTSAGAVIVSDFGFNPTTITQGTDVPPSGVITLPDDAVRFDYVVVDISQMIDGTMRSIQSFVIEPSGTRYDISTHAELNAMANPKYLEPGTYMLEIPELYYMNTSGDPIPAWDLASCVYTVTEKEETPEPDDVGELTYSNLKQPEGAVIQQGDEIPLSGTVRVTGGAKYLSAIKTTLYQVVGSDANGEEYLTKHGSIHWNLSDTKPTSYTLASQVECFDTIDLEPGVYFICTEVAFMGGNGEETWDAFMPSGRFTIEGKDPGTVTVTGIQTPVGYFTEGTNYPLAGIIKVAGGAQYITSVFAYIDNYDEYCETYEADYESVKPTQVDISKVAFADNLNIKNLAPGEYVLSIDVSYIDANGEFNNKIIVFDYFTILSKTPVNPGTITVEDLSYPSGELVEGTSRPLDGVIKVKDGAQYIACIYGELFKDGVLLEDLEADWLLEEEATQYDLDNLGFSFRVSPEELEPGEYSLRVWVDFIDASGEWVSYGDIVNTRYTVIADANPTPYPGGIKVTNFGIEHQAVYPGQALPLTGTISVANGAKEITQVWFGVYQNGSWVDDFQYSLGSGTTSITLSAAHDVATKANPASREPGEYEFAIVYIEYVGSNDEVYSLDDLHGAIDWFIYTVEDVGYGDEPTPTPGGVQLKGDANEDGIINVADAMMIRQHIAGYSVPIDMTNADVNRDNIVNVADAMMIRQFIAYGTILP